MLEDAHMAGVDVRHDCVWIYPDIFVELPIFHSQIFYFQDVIEIQNAWLTYSMVLQKVWIHYSRKNSFRDELMEAFYSEARHVFHLVISRHQAL